jgi:succinate dehydrogenase hydrophobic anchor subunit
MMWLNLGIIAMMCLAYAVSTMSSGTDKRLLQTITGLLFVTLIISVLFGCTPRY